MNFTFRFEPKEHIIYGILFLISFYLFNGMQAGLFNSDQAIQVLMLEDFTWPQDSYYWGQNRLGSLLPLLTLPFYHLLPLHPVMVMSLVNFAMLITGWYLFARFIPTFTGRFFFAIAVFLPHPALHYNLLMGHPYQGQFFALALSTLFLPSLQNHLLRNDNISLKVYLQLIFTLFWIITATWVYEISLLWFVFIGLYVLWQPALRLAVWTGLKNRKLWPAIIILAIFTLAGLLVILDLKHMCPGDPDYDKIFLQNTTQIKAQFMGWLNNLHNSLLLGDNKPLFENLSWWVWILAALTGWIHYRHFSSEFKSLWAAFFITAALCLSVLFFSYWLLRGGFDPKYFGTLFMLAGIPAGILLGLFQGKIRYVMLAAWTVPLLLSGYTFHKQKQRPYTLTEEYAPLQQIEKGVYIGSYWSCYKLAAASNFHLVGVSEDAYDRRNKWHASSWRKQQRFYFSPGAEKLHRMGVDSVSFDGIYMRALKQEYHVSQDTLLAYQRIE